MSRVAEANDRAAQWLAAQEDGDWSASDQAEFEAWLGASDGNRAAYWRLRHCWREAGRLAALGPGAGGMAGPSERPGRGWVPVAIVASLIALILTGWAGMHALAPVPAAITAEYSTPVGGNRAIGLSDGSHVELNTASHLRTAIRPDRREVWLEAGEAYFEVRHLADRPFIVHAGQQQVVVLGTRFSVRRDGDKVAVSVADGRVRVDEMHGNEPVRSSIITAGDVAIAQGGTMLVADRSTERVESTMAWREGMLSFDQARLADVAAEFNRYNRRTLVIDNPEAAAMRIGGRFPARDPEGFSRLLRDAYGLRVEERPAEIRISD